jgi:hypothetical protein
MAGFPENRRWNRLIKSAMLWVDVCIQTWTCSCQRWAALLLLPMNLAKRSNSANGLDTYSASYRLPRSANRNANELMEDYVERVAMEIREMVDEVILPRVVKNEQ